MRRPRDLEVFKTQFSRSWAGRQRFAMRTLCLLLTTFTLRGGIARAQNNAVVAPRPGDTEQIANIEQRLNDLTTTLRETQKALQQSLLEIQGLRSQLDALHSRDGVEGKSEAPAEKGDSDIAWNAAASSMSSSSVQGALQELHERQEILQAEIKQHDQSKVETDSKYTLRVTGIALFNAFSNAGVVDNAELPELALPRVAGASHGSNGATLRQTVLGIAANGPAIAGAHSSAFLNVDFFGGTSTNAYGYTSQAGYVRMRDGEVGLDWKSTSVKAGYTGPLISPRSPTSYATLAEPALAGSGNLWTWSPQVRVEKRVSLGGDRGVSLEGGLIYPASSTYNAIQLDSPVEASRRPGIEGRLAYHSDRTATASPRSFVFGVGGYKASQFYGSATHVRSWAVTGDWQIPLTKHFDLSGEIYRGSALGGFGGGLYKDVIVGTDYNTGLNRTVGVDTAGGWSQLKLNVNSRVEANAAFGLDDAFSKSFDGVILPVTSSPIALAARNDSVIGNVIFRPRASMILSPEYRHIISWSYTGAPNVANIFTLSAGYQF